MDFHRLLKCKVKWVITWSQLAAIQQLITKIGTPRRGHSPNRSKRAPNEKSKVFIVQLITTIRTVRTLTTSILNTSSAYGSICVGVPLSPFKMLSFPQLCEGELCDPQNAVDILCPACWNQLNNQDFKLQRTFNLSLSLTLDFSTPHALSWGALSLWWAAKYRPTLLK